MNLETPIEGLMLFPIPRGLGYRWFSDTERPELSDNALMEQAWQRDEQGYALFLYSWMNPALKADLLRLVSFFSQEPDCRCRLLYFRAATPDSMKIASHYGAAMHGQKAALLTSTLLHFDQRYSMKDKDHASKLAKTISGREETATAAETSIVGKKGRSPFQAP